MCHYMSVIEMVADNICLNLKIRFSEKHLVLVTCFIKYFCGLMKLLF